MENSALYRVPSRDGHLEVSGCICSLTRACNSVSWGGEKRRLKMLENGTKGLLEPVG